jgi:predicted DNA-binding ribbon-helix-helix protein
MYISISRDIIRYMSKENSVKILQTMDDSIYDKLEKIAKRKGITVQELIRAVVIPTWLETQKD